jgi:hypothetical protein
VKKLLFLVFLVVSLLMIAFPVLAIDCKVITTKDYAIEDKFYKTLSEAIPLISTTQKVLKKEYFTIYLLLTDYQVDQNKVANIDYDIRIFDPQGKVYFEKQNLAAYKDRITIAQQVLMAESFLKICFEPEDQLGVYTIQIVLRDHVAKAVKEYKSIISLVKYQNQKQFQNDQSFGEWMHKYYTAPAPERAIDAFLYYSKRKTSEKDTSFLPVFAFFMEIFNNNRYLFPYLTDLYISQDLKTKIYIIYLYRYCNYDLGALTEKTSKKEKEVYQKILAESLPDPYGKIEIPSQLDMLWSVFVASGSYRPNITVSQCFRIMQL